MLWGKDVQDAHGAQDAQGGVQGAQDAQGAQGTQDAQGAQEDAQGAEGAQGSQSAQGRHTTHPDLQCISDLLGAERD